MQPCLIAGSATKITGQKHAEAFRRLLRAFGLKHSYHSFILEERTTAQDAFHSKPPWKTVCKHPVSRGLAACPMLHPRPMACLAGGDLRSLCRPAVSDAGMAFVRNTFP